MAKIQQPKNPKIKKLTKTKAVKTLSKVQVVKTTKKPTSKPKGSGLNVPVFDITGKSQGTISLPMEIFGVKPNERLLAQAMRVYTANLHRHTASTKTRSQVRGGGAKPWRQKGTGRARAGSRRSPLWVGGGTVFGPSPRDSKLSLPQKMKHKALIYALSKQTSEGNIKIISNIDKISPKTKIVAHLLSKITEKGSTTFITDAKIENLKLATRNIPEVFVETAQNVNAYKVLAPKNLLVERVAIEKFK